MNEQWRHKTSNGLSVEESGAADWNRNGGMTSGEREVRAFERSDGGFEAE